MTDEQIQALKEPHGSSSDLFSEAERAALQFAEKVTAWPGNIHQDDLDAMAKHFDAMQLVELVLTIATANLTNRFNEGLRVPVDV